MAKWLVAMLALTLPLAGCLGDDEEPDEEPSDDTGTGTEPTPPLPEDIEASEMVVASADPLNAVGMGICSSPAGQCFRYPFSTEAEVSLDALVEWTVDANDFDLYLVEGEEQVAVSGQQPPGTSEGFTVTVAPGSYELVVVAWAVTQDTFTLTGTFSSA